MSGSKFPRLLAPAPPGINDAIEGDGRRRNVGVACLACKTRKLKCSNEHPCSNCRKNNIECTINKDSDKRRRDNLKRKIEVLEEKEDILIRLVDTLRDSGQNRTAHLLNFIRGNNSLAEIKRYIDTHLSRSELEKTPALIEVRNEVERRLQQSGPPTTRRMLDAKRLSDTSVFKVPAKPWTSVVDNDDFVSHLVSLWFTWFHPFCNWIDRDTFIRYMKMGNVRSQFCSPLLVNAILADACAYSDFPEAYATPGDPASKGAHFYSEAKRYLDEEEGKITLPTVQGLGVMWIYTCLAEKERSRWIHHNQLIHAVQELSHQNPPHLGNADENAIRLARVVNHTIWGLYNVNTMYSAWYGKIPSINLPQRPLPSSEINVHDNDLWYRYPVRSDGVQAHTRCLFSALCSLNQITYNMTRIFFNTEYKLPWSEIEFKAEELHSRLRDWMIHLPSCLKNETSFDLPHVLSLHMYYHSMILRMFSIIRRTTNIDARQRAHETCLSSARTISKLMHLHRSACGADHIPVLNFQWVTDALLILLDRLSDAKDRDAFINLNVAAKALGRRWPLGKKMLRLVQNRAEEMRMGTCLVVKRFD
ncbi:hypothetical protein MW887_008233 [Aspergillus wentii]|nr:hypothetical protein MW887_008233 [Aspergillus wentii]